MSIEFYSARDEYGCFSNFAAYPIVIDGARWPTSEHYFQAQKFVGTDDPWAEAIRRANSPMIAARMGRSRKHPIRRDWEAVKDNVMRKAVLAKFQAHAEIRAILLGTGDQEIVEATTRDDYWGCGSSGTGTNRLGQILMEVRQALRQHENQPAPGRGDTGD